MRLLLALHAILLLLASTSFTIVTSVLGDTPLRWSYFRYSSQSGMGYEYVSEYSLAEVVTYLLAFALGCLGFGAALRQRKLIGSIGLFLSVLGLVSFSIEGSHWLFNHNRVWLAYSAPVMYVLVILACLPQNMTWGAGKLSDDRAVKSTS